MSGEGGRNKERKINGRGLRTINAIIIPAKQAFPAPFLFLAQMRDTLVESAQAPYCLS